MNFFPYILCFLIFTSFGYKIDQNKNYEQEKMSTDPFTNFLDDGEEGVIIDPQVAALVNNARLGKLRKNVAQNAFQDRIDASKAQKLAGAAAAKKVKSQLADRAIAAAKDAEGALENKIKIVKELEQQLHDSEKIVAEETNSLHNAQKTVNIAFKTLQQAKAQLSTFSDAVQAAKINVENAKKSANGAKSDMLEKEESVHSIRDRIEKLEQQLVVTKQDFKNTKQAAYEAACIAHEAIKKADRSRRKLQQRHMNRLIHRLHPKYNNFEK
ncbi:uncharacterized protein LOC119644205 isoform X1 [Glossina fuscipes]|uniref:Uncharacterized protein LOC119644205 isoform X1 n=2 Tax=Glossina fuscipes TaxID=7396 RepID=A0A9C5ZMF9_9MUSC|nr:uncharacterized protein LOC119644205 isoform X1 [Glossina fuscipes]